MNSTHQPSNIASSNLALMAACGAGVLWGTGALVVNILVAQHGFTPENISFWRFMIGAVILVMFFGRRIVWSKVKSLWLSIILSGTAMAGYVLLWFCGIEQIGASVPTLIALCLPPVIVTIIAIIRGQEKADVSLVLILTGAILGTLFIVMKQNMTTSHADSHSAFLGIAFSIGSALLYAGFSMVSGRISSTLGAGPATTCLTFVASLVMGLFAFYRPLTWPSEVPPQAWFLYLGVVTAALALLAFSWGAARLKPTVLTVATLLEPLTAVILSALFLDEYLSTLQWIGGLLLLVSIWALGNRK